MVGKWLRHQHGDGCTARLLEPGLAMSVIREAFETITPGDPIYNVIVFDKKLPGRSSTMEEGRLRAEEYALERLKEAMGNLATIQAARKMGRQGVFIGYENDGKVYWLIDACDVCDVSEDIGKAHDFKDARAALRGVIMRLTAGRPWFIMVNGDVQYSPEIITAVRELN